jgi:hypothetical protein
MDSEKQAACGQAVSLSTDMSYMLCAWHRDAFHSWGHSTLAAAACKEEIGGDMGGGRGGTEGESERERERERARAPPRERERERERPRARPRERESI